MNSTLNWLPTDIEIWFESAKRNSVARRMIKNVDKLVCYGVLRNAADQYGLDIERTGKQYILKSRSSTY